MPVLCKSHIETAALGWPVEQLMWGQPPPAVRVERSSTALSLTAEIILRSIAFVTQRIGRTPKMSLSTRVALVAGASQGIGRTCALRLAKDGATVAVAARNQEKLNELVAEIGATGGKAVTFALDVADEEQVKSTIKAVLAGHGKIDILVN